MKKFFVKYFDALASLIFVSFFGMCALGLALEVHSGCLRLESAIAYVVGMFFAAPAGLYCMGEPVLTNFATEFAQKFAQKTRFDTLPDEVIDLRKRVDELEDLIEELQKEARKEQAKCRIEEDEDDDGSGLFAEDD